MPKQNKQQLQRQWEREVVFKQGREKERERERERERFEEGYNEGKYVQQGHQ